MGATFWVRLCLIAAGEYSLETIFIALRADDGGHCLGFGGRGA